MAADRPTAARSSPSPPTSARARSWSRRARRPSCSASSREHLHRGPARGVRRATSSSRCSAPTPLYEGLYLLGTSIARPLIAKQLVEIAAATGADAVAHGATGKGNDQVRFELSAYALEPDIKVIAPWRDWAFKLAHRPARLRRAAPDPDRQGQARRGAVLGRRQPAALLLRGQGAGGPGRARRREYVYQRTVSPRTRPTRHRDRDRLRDAATPVALDGKALSPAALLTRLNELGRDNGIGRLDLVENRFVGMKSRGVYETPGGTILLAAHRGIESITLDRGAAHLKDELMPRYAELIYNGFWFAPEREMLQALIDKSQEHVEGEVRLKLYKGNVIVDRPHSSPKSLYSEASSPSRTTRGAYDQKDAAGFIRLNALRLRTLGQRRRKLDKG